ncbi:jg14601 [Pararge aegeria aegeria]|uniref:Jg14601 protein n=1 Tax=Pararge aegeria aegeria TaxID=348720 RepID=A0A8S4QY93_9NEOP|nr:jg14601 [Pararge aegeria aegeria]
MATTDGPSDRIKPRNNIVVVVAETSMAFALPQTRIIYFGECAQELFDLVPPSPFYHRTARHRKDLHPYVVDIPRMRTERFAFSFLIRTARIWNALPASIFSIAYNMSTFKSRVNRRAPP